MNIHREIELECQQAEEKRLALYIQLWHMIDLVEKNEGQYDTQPLKEAMARLESVITDLDLFKDGGGLD
jgi:hypothetical protein